MYQIGKTSPKVDNVNVGKAMWKQALLCKAMWKQALLYVPMAGGDTKWYNFYEMKLAISSKRTGASLFDPAIILLLGFYLKYSTANIWWQIQKAIYCGLIFL